MGAATHRGAGWRRAIRAVGQQGQREGDILHGTNKNASRPVVKFEKVAKDRRNSVGVFLISDCRGKDRRGKRSTLTTVDF